MCNNWFQNSFRTQMNFLLCIPWDLQFFSFADWVSVAGNLACLRLETLMSDLVKVTQDESVCDTLNIPRLCLSSPLFLWVKKKHTPSVKLACLLLLLRLLILNRSRSFIHSEIRRDIGLATFSTLEPA